MVQSAFFPFQSISPSQVEATQSTLLCDHYCIITICAIQAITLTALAITFEMPMFFVGALIALMGGIYESIEFTHAKEKIYSMVKSYFIGGFL